MSKIKFVFLLILGFIIYKGFVAIKNFEVGTDSSFIELKKEHDAILIATGVYKARQVNTPGSDLNNIFPAMKFLTASNKKRAG